MHAKGLEIDDITMEEFLSWIRSKKSSSRESLVNYSKVHIMENFEGKISHMVEIRRFQILIGRIFYIVEFYQFFSLFATNLFFLKRYIEV